MTSLKRCGYKIRGSTDHQAHIMQQPCTMAIRVPECGNGETEIDFTKVEATPDHLEAEGALVEVRGNQIMTDQCGNAIRARVLVI